MKGEFASVEVSYLQILLAQRLIEGGFYYTMFIFGAEFI